MQIRGTRRIAAALAVTGLLSVPAAGQGNPGVAQPPRDRVPAAPRAGTAVVKGRVVDGTTGAAIARARVMLQGPAGRPTVLTGADGAFVFTNVAPGALALSAEKSTYLPARYPAAGRTIRSAGRPAPIAEGQVIDGVTIQMFHGGAISGRVIDANGDPIDYAQVSVIRVPSAGRAGRPMSRASMQSNDLGEYRVGRLEAGTYVVQVTARRPGPDDNLPPGVTPPPPLPQPLPTFYPSAASFEQAQPIVLERGQNLSGIDVVLGEGLPAVITGVVTTATGQPISGNAYVTMRVVVGEGNPTMDMMTSGFSIRPDGTFRSVVAPGEYMLEARVTPRTSNGATRPEDELTASTKIVAVAGVEDSVALTVGPGATASGRVVFEGSTPAPPSPGKARIPLYSETGQCRSGEATIAADWSFKVEGLSGTCRAQPQGFFGRWMLKAVTINGEDLVDTPFTFQPGQQLRNVQVTVTDRRSTMTFRVADENGGATRDYLIVVYPVEKSRWTTGSRIFVGPPDPIGGAASSARPGAAVVLMPPRREMLSGLRPGDYYVIAVDDMEPEDPRDPLVLERLRGAATRVTLGEGETIEVALRRVAFAGAVASR